ncbi:endonuclease [Pedobacter polaris]|uniref:Endonuclease n=1 Tax=Pedobacter polaris TaxID=2571273 RepID=A0A4U1CSL9_9SPHI|nr:endonuclease/exonuclease/phosphatase family protein [Pedobacter polaris]TKC12127.1 endonuclease [Pedobacter polaris]
MEKKKLTFFDKLMVFTAICVAIGLICGILAGKNDPREHIILAFFGLAYPFFLLANVIMLLWWLLRKKWVFSLVTILIVCSGWHTLIATFGFFGKAGEKEKTEQGLVRVMTYNVHNFRPYGDAINPEVKEKMLKVVRDQNPDVICFQEFFTKPKGPFDTIDSLKKLLNTKYYYFVPTMKSASEAFGLAIFSKYPINNKDNILFEVDAGNECIYVDLTIKEQVLRVYNVHLQSISFEKEDYNYLEKVTKDMDVEKGSSKRIVRMLKTAFLKRSAQVDLMKAHMKTCTTPYVVVGDFNDTPASYAVTKMTDSLNNAFIKKGAGLGRTYNGKFPNFQIDYIATSKDIEVTNYHIVEAKLSDHFPVRSDLRLKTLKP